LKVEEKTKTYITAFFRAKPTELKIMTEEGTSGIENKMELTKE
jgi:hypothetical protein